MPEQLLDQLGPAIWAAVIAELCDHFRRGDHADHVEQHAMEKLPVVGELAHFFAGGTESGINEPIDRTCRMAHIGNGDQFLPRRPPVCHCVAAIQDPDCTAALCRRMLSLRAVMAAWQESR